MSSNSLIASLTPLLCKSKLSIIDERTIDTKNSFPSPANFPSRVISCSLSPYPSMTLPKSCSVRYSVSSLGQNNKVDSNYGDEDEDEDKEKQNKSSYTKNINVRSLVDTVVKVFCVRAFQSYTYPWLMEEEESFRSGFIISGRRVLTSARAINLHMEVKLKKKNSDTWFTASVLALAYESDLAMLTVNDDKFWEGVKPVDFGDLPAPKENITVIGYPHMRDFVSVTEGRVSQLGMTRYESWEASLLAFKVKVAGDEGKVGGPVFNTRGECVGLILQWIDNVTTVVPTEVIKHFIQDCDKNGAHTALPILAIKWQKMESFSLRVFMKMEPDQQGVLITEVNPNYPECLDERYHNWKIPDEDEVLSEAFYEERVVLCKVTFLSFHDLSRVLKGDITTGYEAEEEVQNQVIVAFNDRPVKGLKSLVSMVESCGEEFLKFTLENHKHNLFVNEHNLPSHKLQSHPKGKSQIKQRAVLSGFKDARIILNMPTKNWKAGYTHGMHYNGDESRINFNESCRIIITSILVTVTITIPSPPRRRLIDHTQILTTMEEDDNNLRTLLA
ncbi:protease Do-like 9 [Rhododendron vialii]|uniref:protease Do-like 9 n=1 Tax=Rhododendron vialii TaxID=182163 RepID=UPI00266053E0|nr:protease Do-like 9 [Rhododendron vialii]